MNSNGGSSLIQNLLVIYVFVYFTSKIGLIGTRDNMPLKTNEQELISLFGGVVCFILIYYFTNLEGRDLLVPSKRNNYYIVFSFILGFIFTRYLVGEKEAVQMGPDDVGDSFNRNPVLMGAVLCLIAGMVIMNMFFSNSNGNNKGYISYFFYVALAFISIYVLMKSNQTNTVQNLSLSTVVLLGCFLLTSDIETDFISMNFIQIFLMVFFVMLISKFGIHSIVYKDPLVNQGTSNPPENSINISSSFLILITIMSVVFFYFTSQES